MIEVNLSEIINNVLVPILEVGFPIAIIFALTERFTNMFLSFIRGDEHVKL